MRYRQTLVLTVDVDDSTFDAGWPHDVPWNFLLQEHLERNGRSTEHAAVDVACVDPEVLDLGYLERDGPEDGYGYGYSPGDWQHKHTEPVHVPYYVNVYSVGQGYGGPEEGGWWFSCGDPIEEACETFESRAAADARAEVLREEYPATRAQYSVLGGLDYEVRVEDHRPQGWPNARPHYC